MAKGVAPKKIPVPDDYRPSAINLRASDWELLQWVARARAKKKGSGRPSASKVVEDLIEANRKALQAEARTALEDLPKY